MQQNPTANWSNSFRYGFRDYLWPASMTELSEAVATSRRIKVLGSRHSFNAIADGAVALMPGRIPLDPRIEDDGRSVSIAGHATYGDLAVFLGGRGLAVHNLASLPHISIAGAIATATHGSGDLNGNLATSITGLEFVTADGSIVTVKRGDPDFEGTVVHLGALGVVSRVTLAARPAFEISQRVFEGLGWEPLCENLDRIMGLGYSVSIFTRWNEVGGHVWVKSEGAAGDIPEALFGARPAGVKRHPIIGLDTANTTDQLGVAGPWSDRLPHFKLGFTASTGDEIQSEFHLPRKHGVAAIEALHRISGSFATLVQVTEFRTVAADRLWLSPQFGRDTLSIHFTWVPDGEAVDAAVRRIEEALLPFDALPHWGKVFSRTHAGGRYARLADFRRIRDKMDPEGKFSNPWLDEVVFGLRGIG